MADERVLGAGWNVWPQDAGRGANCHVVPGTILQTLSKAQGKGPGLTELVALAVTSTRAAGLSRAGPKQPRTPLSSHLFSAQETTGSHSFFCSSAKAGGSSTR